MAQTSLARPGNRTEDVRTVRRIICDAVADVCVRNYHKNLAAIILTGSLARNEATAVAVDGRMVLFSDADFLLVFRSRFSQPNPADVAQVSNEIETELSAQDIVVHAGLGVVTAKYFSKLPADTFTFELRNCGDVIWGDANVLGLVPDYVPAQLSRENAWRTLCNRCVELLLCLDLDEFRAGRLNDAAQYATVKLYLDMATSYLVFAGRYEPTYRSRANRLKALGHSIANEPAPFPLETFSKHVTEATEQKFSGELNMACGSVRLAINYAQQLWRWEATQLTNAAPTLPIATLTTELAKKQGIVARAHGWLSLLRRAGSHCSQYPRWMTLSRHGTPRYLVYAAALYLLQVFPTLVDGRQFDETFKELNRLLPECTFDHADSDWQRLVLALRTNYETFLTGTRA